MTTEIERRRMGALTLEDAPALDPDVAERWAQYAEIRSAAVADWAPGGDGLLIHTRFSQTEQLFHVAAPGARRRQLTFYPEPIGAVAACPDAARPQVLFLKDAGGDEFTQVYRYDWGSGGTDRISDGASQNGAPLWTPAGDRFLYGSTRRNGTDRDLWLAAADEPANPRLVLQEGGSWSPVAWSPDGQRVIVQRYVSIVESHLHVLEPETGRLVPVRPDAGRVAYGDAVWCPDGRGIYLVSDEGSEFTALRRYDLDTGIAVSLSGDIPWDVGQIVRSPDGRTLVFQVNADGYSELYALETAGGTPRRIPLDLPPGRRYGLRFHPTRNVLAFHTTAPDEPGDAYTLELADGRVTRWTFSETADVNPRGFVRPSLIRYPTFDAVDGRPREIPAFYYRPAGPGPFPVLIQIHGGPESQTVARFDPALQFFAAEEGIAVLAPNVRGSSGYGRTYVGLDDGYRREDSVRDIGALLDWIASRSELDAGRVAVMGASYGGYMVLSCIVHYSDRLACGVEAVGISNFVTFLENTQSYRRDLRRAEYGDERDPEMRRFLESISPRTNVACIRRPLLIAQGRNDPRVPASESEAMIAAIREQGGRVAYLLADNEGHGFKKKDNRQAYLAATTQFLRQHLNAKSE